MTTDTTHAAPFTPAEARSIVDNIRRADTDDLAAWRTRAARVAANYRGVPTTTAHNDVVRADRIAATIDTELRSRAADIVTGAGFVTLADGSVSLVGSPAHVADMAAADVVTAATPTPSDPVDTTDGQVRLGMALGSLGFAPVVDVAAGGNAPRHMYADHDPSGVRVTTSFADNAGTIVDEVIVTAWGRDGRGAGWEVTFTGSTPVDVIAAAVAVAVGRLDITA